MPYFLFKDSFLQPMQVPSKLTVGLKVIEV